MCVELEQIESALEQTVELDLTVQEGVLLQMVVAFMHGGIRQDALADALVNNSDVFKTLSLKIANCVVDSIGTEVASTLSVGDILR